MPVADHHAQARQPVACAVITVSDTRTEADDTSGQLMRDLLQHAGHQIVHYSIVRDDPGLIQTLLGSLAAEKKVQAVLLNGGTGLSRRDSTYEAIHGLLEKRLDGFGELFRMLSYYDIGPAAMMSRAVAGTYHGVVVFSTPGSTPAVRLAMEKLILPELAHIAWEMTRQGSGGACSLRHFKPEAPPGHPAGATSQPTPEQTAVIVPQDRAVFNSAKMGKATLFESPRLLVGLNAFEPGQEHALHSHAGMDKVYHVLQGRGLFLLEGRELPMTAGQMLIAPAGVPHGIRNHSEERLVVLAILAPAPQGK